MSPEGRNWAKYSQQPSQPEPSSSVNEPPTKPDKKRPRYFKILRIDDGLNPNCPPSVTFTSRNNHLEIKLLVPSAEIPSEAIEHPDQYRVVGRRFKPSSGPETIRYTVEPMPEA